MYYDAMRLPGRAGILRVNDAVELLNEASESDPHAPPHLALVARMWEDMRQAKKIECRWFYRPTDVPTAMLRTLPNGPALPNELFLSDVHDANRVESIAAIAKLDMVAEDADPKQLPTTEGVPWSQNAQLFHVRYAFTAKLPVFRALTPAERAVLTEQAARRALRLANAASTRRARMRARLSKAQLLATVASAMNASDGENAAAVGDNDAIVAAIAAAAPARKRAGSSSAQRSDARARDGGKSPTSALVKRKRGAAAAASGERRALAAPGSPDAAPQRPAVRGRSQRVTPADVYSAGQGDDDGDGDAPETTGRARVAARGSTSNNDNEDDEDEGGSAPPPPRARRRSSAPPPPPPPPQVTLGDVPEAERCALDTLINAAEASSQGGGAFFRSARAGAGTSAAEAVEIDDADAANQLPPPYSPPANQKMAFSPAERRTRPPSADASAGSGMEPSAAAAAAAAPETAGREAVGGAGGALPSGAAQQNSPRNSPQWPRGDGAAAAIMRWQQHTLGGSSSGGGGSSGGVKPGASPESPTFRAAAAEAAAAPRRRGGSGGGAELSGSSAQGRARGQGAGLDALLDSQTLGGGGTSGSSNNRSLQSWPYQYEGVAGGMYAMGMPGMHGAAQQQQQQQQQRSGSSSGGMGAASRSQRGGGGAAPPPPLMPQAIQPGHFTSSGRAAQAGVYTDPHDDYAVQRPPSSLAAPGGSRHHAEFAAGGGGGSGGGSGGGAVAQRSVRPRLGMEQGSGGGQTALYLDALAAFVKSTAKYLPPASHSQLKEALFAFDSGAWSWSDTEADIAAVLSGLPNEHALLQELNTLGEQIAACMASGNGARAPRSGGANASNLTPGVPSAWGDLGGAAGNMMQLQPMTPSLSTPFWSAASLSSPSAPYGRVSQMPQLNPAGGGGTAAAAAAAAASAAAAPPMNRPRPPLARSGASANQEMAWGLHERDLSYNIPQLTQQGHSSSGSSAHRARHGQQMQGHQGASAQYRSASRTAAAAHSGDLVYRDMSAYPGSQHAGSHFHQQILNDVYGGDDVIDPRTAYPPLVASAPPAQQHMGSPTASPTHTAYRPPSQTWAYRD